MNTQFILSYSLLFAATVSLLSAIYVLIEMRRIQKQANKLQDNQEE